jgi:hypothetical protein
MLPIDARPLDGTFYSARKLTDTEAAKSRPQATGSRTLTTEVVHATAGRKPA